MLVDQELTYRIQGCVFEVFRQLGHGFLEKVYEQALLVELALAGLEAKAQQPIKIHYKGEVVGEYLADVMVEGRVILELKAQEKLTSAHEAQLLNYLKATGIPIGLLVNFWFPRAEVRRFVL